jgi:hypothetical protein
MAYRWNAKAPKQRVSFFFTVWLTSIFATDGLALDRKFRTRSGLGMSFAKGMDGGCDGGVAPRQTAGIDARARRLARCDPAMFFGFGGRLETRSPARHR